MPFWGFYYETFKTYFSSIPGENLMAGISEGNREGSRKRSCSESDSDKNSGLSFGPQGFIHRNPSGGGGGVPDSKLRDWVDLMQNMIGP